MDEYYYDEDTYDPDEGKVTGGKILKNVVKYTFIAIIISVNALLLWRCVSSIDPAFAKDYYWNKEAFKSYNDSPNDFAIHYVERDGNLQYAIQYKDKFSNRQSNATFSATHVYVTPSAGQIQFTVRYNNSTLKEIMKDYGLDSLPDNEPFAYVLCDSYGNLLPTHISTPPKRKTFIITESSFSPALILILSK